MIQLKDNGKTRYYFDEYGLLRERGHGIGDCLWRIALMLIATGRKELLEAVKEQVRKVNGKYRFFRHPDDMDNDASRDQAIPTIIALKLHEPEFHKEVIDNLSYRISGKFTWQEAWFWAKEKYTLWTILSFYHCITIWFQPAYSIHLLCWMIWHSGRNRRVLRWLLLNIIVSKENYLLRILLNDELSEEDKDAIKSYKPRRDFIWQREFPGTIKHSVMGSFMWLLSGIAWGLTTVNDSWQWIFVGLLTTASVFNIIGLIKDRNPVKPHKLMTPEEAEYNTFDRTVLIRMYYRYEGKL